MGGPKLLPDTTIGGGGSQSHVCCNSNKITFETLTRRETLKVSTGIAMKRVEDRHKKQTCCGEGGLLGVPFVCVFATLNSEALLHEYNSVITRLSFISFDS
eukprot:TRINITY_DN5462_c0_g1_i1.p1 TRINITY_DN5462_c0_g1~~TRINITY_DN5462_c0_g1_i1.p1  ORF type:complete len:101 (-),score=5.84 TRINITY_DN5462_c0_g1_i1:119-421(-)